MPTEDAKVRDGRKDVVHVSVLFHTPSGLPTTPTSVAPWKTLSRH